MDVGARIIVRGLVQGVGFRYFVLRHASTLGLSGYVQNTYNGDVEIEVEGSRSLVEELIKEVKAGPRSAHVSDVKIEWKSPEQSFHGFEIR
ncbi:MAG: acylphosphatase [Nitrososphaera sp.]|nr:acylphosphatase [Nitrososphaera sp.]MCI0707728.1 acylphosphatase [Ignavibacteriota bacterium]